jgi:hypothetical protein
MLFIFFKYKLLLPFYLSASTFSLSLSLSLALLLPLLMCLLTHTCTHTIWKFFSFFLSFALVLLNSFHSSSEPLQHNAMHKCIRHSTPKKKYVYIYIYIYIQRSVHTQTDTKLCISCEARSPASTFLLFLDRFTYVDRSLLIRRTAQAGQRHENRLFGRISLGTSVLCNFNDFFFS